MNLDEFLKCGSRNGYICEPGFYDLYVRKSVRLLDNPSSTCKTDKFIKYKAFDIASVEVFDKGKGTFKKFVARLRRDYPEFAIYVENVQPEKFKEGLVRMGFVRCKGVDACFLLPPEYPLKIDDLSQLIPT